MKRTLSHPLTNAIGISAFSLFYALIFILTARQGEFQRSLFYNREPNIGSGFWVSWSHFLAAGRQQYIAYILIGLTALVVFILVSRRHPYDEYHTSILIQCLVVAVVLTLLAIALFYLMVLSDTNGIVEKFTLFITIHWSTVVLADLVYLLICQWR
jgi:hypothetical protein